MLKFRKAITEDVILFYNWANDETVRQQSFHSNPIDLDNHIKWFNNKIADNNCEIYVFENEQKNKVGQIRLQKEEENIYIIGISIAKEYRGKGYAVELLKLSSNFFLSNNIDQTIYAYIKSNNIASIKSFLKAGFVFEKELIFNNSKSVLYTKKYINENS